MDISTSDRSSLLPLTTRKLGQLDLFSLSVILLAFPVLYFVASYVFLAWWHKKTFLLNTLIHENGRLTLAGSMFYFDHFVACVPMIALFSLFAAGGLALSGHKHVDVNTARSKRAAALLLGVAVIMITGAFFASLYTVGTERTLDYAFQRIERDGVTSPGGNWNQLQLSNIPIVLGTLGVSSALLMNLAGYRKRYDRRLAAGGWICVGFAVVLMIALSIALFPGWSAFLNPRWMAHSIREIATYPITGIPIALVAIILVESYISGVRTWTIRIRYTNIILIGTAVVILISQLIWIMNVDILAIAQKPSFSAEGLSIGYLLTSHVFEHFLDFVLIALLSAGIYALIRVLTSGPGAE
jgi:hypothetical protein